jgi:hypothetical protein
MDEDDGVYITNMIVSLWLISIKALIWRRAQLPFLTMRFELIYEVVA